MRASRVTRGELPQAAATWRPLGREQGGETQNRSDDDPAGDGKKHDSNQRYCVVAALRVTLSDHREGQAHQRTLGADGYQISW